MCHRVGSRVCAFVSAALLALPLGAAADGVALIATERAAALPGPQGWASLLGNMPAHTTLGLRSAAQGRARSVRLLGNYFVDGALPGDSPTGFRATGGIVLPTASAVDTAPSSIGDFSRRPKPDALQRWTGSTYLGLGYTAAWQSGLRFNADVGLTRPIGSPLSGLGAGTYWLDDEALRNLRPSTSVELGVNYSF